MKQFRAFYFLFFGAAACLLPFLTLYYQQLGLSGREIGVLTGIVPLITLVSASLWGGLADATRKHHAILLLTIAGTWTAVFVMSRSVTFLTLIPIVSVYALFVAPIIALVDNSVMETLGSRRSEYGRQRLWGSVGWGIVAAIIGVVIQRAGLSWGFTGYLGMMALLFLLALRLPVRPGEQQESFGRGLRGLLTNRQWLLFSAVALVEGMSLGVFLNYLFLYLEELGISRTVMGLSLTVATISEIPIFFYSKRLLEKWGTQSLLAFSIAMTVVRAVAYINMTTGWQVLLISLLHGPTFAAMWTAGVAYAGEVAPPGLGATAQGMFGSMVWGFGAALGAITGGFLFEAYGAVATFQFAGAAAFIALVVFVLANRRTVFRPVRVGAGD
jgi:PPP family 3-phenylpropionic acid transporter